MIEYIELRWSNCFSYGPNNRVRFNSTPITQIVGKNGHGKSSIGLILEEVLFNKNSKGIKKGNILNRFSKDKTYSIELDFKKDGSLYTIKTSRGSTQKVALYRDGEDISSHTATGTFQEIENLIGYDHKTFSQIVYQSSVQSLEFLTATDSNRKKFLIELLNLVRYSAALDLFKAEASEVGKKIATVEGKITNLELWMSKYGQQDLSEQLELEVPAVDPLFDTRLAEIAANKTSIQTENKRIAQNNTYKQLRDKVQLVHPPAVQKPTKEDIQAAMLESAQVSAKISSLKAELSKLGTVRTKCPTCGQKLDSNAEEQAKHIQEEKSRISDELLVEQEKLKAARLVVEKLEKVLELFQKAEKQQEEYEKYHSLYDPSISNKPTSLEELESEEAKLLAEKRAQESARDAVLLKNRQIAAHNAKVQSLLEQKKDTEEQLVIANAERSKHSKRFSNLQILTKAFSTTGLIAYKIECLVKDLEQLTNEYLSEMSDGRFQLSFQISGGDKLNVVITDTGQDVEILALSSGERARVNIATLLAIRKLMQSLSKTRSNLLILDETVENLDLEGKEKLIEVLLKEECLNTFLISHGFTHPLLEKLQVIKVDKISYIE